MKTQIWTKLGVNRADVELLFNTFIAWWGTSGNPVLVSLSDNWFVIAIDEDKANGVWDKFQAALDEAKRLKANQS